MRSLFSSFLLAVSFSSLLACGGGTEPKAANNNNPPATGVAALEYRGTCTPAVCDKLPVPEIGCATGDPTKVCSPAKDGACRISISCSDADGTTGSGGDAGGVGGDPDGVTSWEGCGAERCGAVPEIGCPAGYDLSRNCGKENGAATCSWATTCAPRPGELCAPGACGDAVPQIAPICKDGSTGEMVCRKLGDRCGWASNC
jgi:hypothetical protein